MKNTITVLSLIFATSINAQTKTTNQPKTTPQKTAETKTIIATYKYGVTAGGEWSGLIFTDNSNTEIRFLNKNNEEKEIAEFWNPKVTGEDPDDVSAELHTISSNVEKKYKLTYTIKMIKHKGYDEYGASSTNENVIISFEFIP